MERNPVILDTDIGTNPDDFFALLLAINDPVCNLKLVLTGNRYPVERALLAGKILDKANRKDVPVCAGEATGCVEFYAQEYVNGYDRSISNDFTQSIKDIIDSFGVVTYVAIQGLSNPAKFLRKYPEYSKKVEVVHMGMTVKDARDEYIKGGTNMEADQMAAKFIYESGVSLKVVGSHTTINDALRVQPQTGLYKKLASSDTENHKMLLAHLHDYHERRKLWPALHDPLTLAVALGHNFVDFEETSVDINSEGLYKIGTGRTKIMISKTESKTEDFMDYCEKFV